MNEFVSCTPDKHLLGQDLKEYVESDFVRTASFVNGKYQYLRGGSFVRTGGITRELKKQFYPHFNDKKRSRAKGDKTRKSSAKKGKRVHKEVQQYVANGGVRQKSKED